MPRVGIVLAVEGDRARIATTRRGICDGCSEHSECVVGGSSGEGISEEVTARNPLHARPGDQVEFDLPGHTELKLSLLVWTVPLVGLVAGAVLGAGLHPRLALDRDAATLVGMLLGGVAAFGLVVLVDRRARGDERLVPEVVKILTADSCSSLQH